MDNAISDYTFQGVIAPWPTHFRIAGEDGRILLQINGDGTVVGEIEDAGPAAKAFVDALRRQLLAILKDQSHGG